MAVQEFAQTLNDIYGRFDVQPIDGKAFGGAWKRKEATSLDCATVVTENLHVRRQDRALRSEYDDVLFVMLQKEGRQKIDHCGRVVTLCAQDMTVINSIKACDLVSQSRNKVSVIHLRTNSLLEPKAFVSLCGKHLPGRSMKVRLLGEVLTSLSTASKDAETNSDDEEYVQELISAVSRGLDSDCSTAGFRPRRQLADLERYVLLNIHEPELELGRLASAVSLSRRSLYRLFECEGLTPSNWLWSVRLNAARDRLSSEAWQDCSITDIAFAVGFNDSAHFSRAFRKRYGTSPRQFRTASKAEFA
ncbi:MAG: hypothetical protein RLZZ444_3069 [Pseudomonadota bacterium]|jgi:AraC-like DNA-binding protein